MLVRIYTTCRCSVGQQTLFSASGSHKLIGSNNYSALDLNMCMTWFGDDIAPSWDTSTVERAGTLGHFVLCLK